MHVRTAAGDEFEVAAGQCVLATGIPILDRGGFFARLKPQRSYCLAYQVPGDITRGMYISADSPTRSLRYAPAANGDRLIVGGAGHPVGQQKGPASSVQELDAWAKLHFRGGSNALLVGPGLQPDRRIALRRPHPARQRQDPRGNGIRQVGHDQRRRRRLGIDEPNSRRPHGLGADVCELESA